MYDLIIIGGGSGGLSAAAGAAKFGAKVALIEKNKMGGECLWTGCVPSKAIIRSAEVAHLLRTAKEFGLETGKTKFNFSKVINRVQKVIKNIEPHDSPKRFRKLGVDVFFGSPAFLNKHEIAVGKKILRGKKFIISTGSRPYEFPIPGLKEAGYLTNENIFTNKKFPKTFLVIGGGPIGAEMAQAFARLGSKVHIFDRGEHILSKEDKDVSLVVEKVFKQEGINVLTKTEILKVGRKGKKKVIYFKHRGKKKSIAGDEILLAIGRAPNIEGLNLKGIGVKYDKRKIHVNARLQTSVSNIFAVGDVKGGYLFTHMASYEAGIALMNTLFKLPTKADYSIVPWATYVDPEVAHVGLQEYEAKDKGLDYLVLKHPFKDVDRAQTEGEIEGFVKVITDKKGHILGVTIVGPKAGELLAEYVLAIRKKLKIQDIFKTIHTYPTLSGINQQVAGKFYESKLTPRVKKWLQRIFGFG